MIEDELTRELARDLIDDHEAQTVAEALESVARVCWTRAYDLPDHLKDEPAARALIRKALDAAGRTSAEFAAARRIFEAGQFTMPMASKHPEQVRLQITYRLMADYLWDTCVSGSYPYLSTVTGEFVDDASALLHGGGASAPMVNVPNWQKTANAIHRGLAGLKASGELAYLPDRDAIRKALKRL